MKQRYLWVYALLLVSSSVNGAVLFADNFDRVNSDSVGNGWMEHGGGFNGIENNRLNLDNGSNGRIGDNFAYIDLGATLTGVIVSGVAQYDVKGPAASESFYIGLNALESDILSDSNGTIWSTDGAGFGIEVNFGNHTIYAIDETVTAAHVDALDTGVHGLTQLVDFNFELVYGSDGSLGVTLWDVGMDKPSTETYLYTPGVSGPAPVFSGSHLVFGITDEGELQVDDVSVSAVPLPAAIWMFGAGLVCLCGFGGRRKSE